MPIRGIANIQERYMRIKQQCEKKIIIFFVPFYYASEHLDDMGAAPAVAQGCILWLSSLVSDGVCDRLLFQQLVCGLPSLLREK